MAEDKTTEKADQPTTKKKCTGIEKTAKLTVKATDNPKRGASAERFQGYLDKKPKTVQEALDAGLTMGDINYDVIHGFIEVEGAKIEEYTPSPRGPRTSKGPKDSKASGDAEAAKVDEGADNSGF